MTKARAYAVPRSTLFGKAALIQAEIETAFTALADIDVHVIGDDRATALRPLRGLVQVSESAPVIALGRAAHLALSHVRKRTLVAEDLESDPAEDELLEATIETLIWSSVNTTKIVALGSRAWRSIQLLPVTQRRSYPMPPLCMRPADPARCGILVIDHDQSQPRTLAIIEALCRAGLDARSTGCSGTRAEASPELCWTDDSRIHVHVGRHTLDAEEIRLVDSWHSERLVVQVDEERISRPEANASDLKVEDNVNGFVCATSRDIVAICGELLEDRILQRKLIAGGHNSVAPLLKVWQAIAADLLA